MQRHGKKLSAALSKFRERQALQAQIEQTRHRIDSVRNHFEQVVDPTLIDCYIYELNAAQLRYQFLLRRFKSLEVDA
ncbi:MAG: YaaL family protein [Hungatella sp.]|nr:YaaL family protein [Hungatella sp.]